jgi:hypothetical protein
MNRTEHVRHLSGQDFALLGLAHVAYIKPIVVDGRGVYAIHAANGAPIAVTDNFDLAAATVIHNDLEPVRVH